MVFLFAWFFASLLGWDIGILTRDPAATVGFHPLYGAISTVGMLLWCASATLCFFYHLRLSLAIARSEKPGLAL